VGLFWGCAMEAEGSGEEQPQMHISKEGALFEDHDCARGAHILGPFGTKTVIYGVGD